LVFKTVITHGVVITPLPMLGALEYKYIFQRVSRVGHAEEEKCQIPTVPEGLQKDFLEDCKILTLRYLTIMDFDKFYSF